MNEQHFYKEIEAHFCLRTNKTKKPEMIYLIVRIDGKQYKLSCGVKVYPNQWHKGIAEESNLLSKRDNANNKIANKKLTEILERFSKFRHTLCSCDDIITDMGKLLKSFIYKENKTMVKDVKKVNVLDLVNEAFENYYKSRQTKPQSIADYKKKLDLYFFPYVESLNDKSVNVLKQEGFSKWVNWVSEKATPNMANYTMELMARLIKQITIYHPNLGLAVPMYNKVQIKKETQKKNEGKPLTKEEIKALEEYVPKTENQKITQILFLIGLETGARSSDWNKFIQGKYDKITDDGETILIIHPKKTEKKEGNDAYVTLTPRLELLIKEAKDLDIYYLDRQEYDANKGKGYINRIAPATFRNNLYNICENIYKENNALFGRIKRVTSKKVESKPAYEAISSHWARHTFVHECKLKGLPNDIIAKKIGDNAIMVEKTYGYMNKNEIAKQLIDEERKQREIAEPKIEGKQTYIAKKLSLIDAFFAYNDIVSLMDMKETGINIYDDSRLRKVISIIKMSVNKATLDKAINIVNNAEENKIAEFKKKVASIDKFIWEVGKHFADTKLYQMYQYKLNKLGMLDKKPIDTNLLDDIWQSEIYEEEQEILG